MRNNDIPEDLRGLMEHHGHLCFGVLMGYKACKYAVEIIGQSENMTVSVETENCGNDAVRYLMNCTQENKRLIISGGKGQSWSFYNHEEEEGVRLIPNPGLKSQLSGDKDQAMKMLLEMPGHMMFMVEPFNI